MSGGVQVITHYSPVFYLYVTAYVTTFFSTQVFFSMLEIYNEQVGSFRFGLFVFSKLI